MYRLIAKKTIESNDLKSGVQITPYFKIMPIEIADGNYVIPQDALDTARKILESQNKKDEVLYWERFLEDSPHVDREDIKFKTYEEDFI